MWRMIAPQLPVADVSVAQAWYRDVLGAEVTWTRGEGFGAVRAHGVELFLAKAPEPRAPNTLCLLVDDADFVYAVCRERDAEVADPIATKPWGVREFTLRDPDGHLLRIGHSTKR